MNLKMRAVLPIHRLAAEYPQIRFVQNGCSLQRVPRLLAAHFSGRNPMQVAIDQFHELIRGFHVAEAPAVEEARDIVRLAIIRHVH